MASFFLLPVFTNLLGAEQYGILNLLQTFSAILAIGMTLAVERSLFRLFYDYHTEGEKNRFLSSVFWLICINSIVIIGITMLLGHFIIHYLGDVDFYTILLPVVIYTFMNAIINFTLIIMQIEQNGRQYLIISLLLLVVYNFLAILLIVFFRLTVQSLVYASLITYIIVTPIAYYIIRKKICFVIDKQCITSVFKFSSPILLMVIFAWILQFSDRLFIANMSSYVDVGIYSLAAKIVSIITLFAGAIFQSYGPYFYHLVNTLPEDEAKIKLKETNSTIIFFVCLLGIIVILLSKSVLDLFFSNEFSSTLIYIYMLSVSMVFSQQTGVLNLMILQNKKTGLYSIVTILGGLISVFLNYFLIPIYGAIFAAVSNLIVGIFMMNSMYLLAKRNYYIKFDFIIFFYSLLVIFICIFCDLTIKNHWIALVTKVLFCVIWYIIGLQLKIINQNNLKHIGSAICNKMHIKV